MAHRYQELAEEFIHKIEKGLYQSGDKLPGIRTLSTERALSMITVVSAYRRLEEQGYLEARPRSGYFVRQRPVIRKLQLVKPTEVPVPCLVTGQEMILAMSKAVSDPDCIKLGSAVPGPSFFPMQLVHQALVKAIQQKHRLAAYEQPAGAVELRLQLARRMAMQGYLADADDIIVTNGGQEALALALALRAVTQAGDLVAVESPTFYGLLQVIKSLGLKVIEIPTDPEQGISLEALQLAAEQWPIRACVLIPNFNNPQGFVMSDPQKLKLIGLLTRHKISIIEDDTYGDLGYSQSRPATLISLAPEADILYCNTFSKSMSPDLRIGWVTSNRHKSALELLKFSSNVATSSVTQCAVASVLASGKYDRHLRKVRLEYQLAVERMVMKLCRLLPEDCHITVPKGGFLLWLQLPEHIDANHLANAALNKGISIAPGQLFSPTQKYPNYVRLSCARLWDARMDYAIRTLAELITHADSSVA
jgi:DNA-binding transcriptional MocR family regulator